MSRPRGASHGCTAHASAAAARSARVDTTADRMIRCDAARGIAAARCRAGIICANVSRFVGLLGVGAVEVVPDSCPPQLARRRSLRLATHNWGSRCETTCSPSLEQQVPLQADGWERALQLTRARRQPSDTPGTAHAAFHRGVPRRGRRDDFRTGDSSRSALHARRRCSAGRAQAAASADRRQREICAPRARRMAIRRAADLRPRRHRAVSRPERHRQDDVGAGDRARAQAARCCASTCRAS